MPRRNTRMHCKSGSEPLPVRAATAESAKTAAESAKTAETTRSVLTAGIR
jgi:hypothetical protein